LTGKSASGSPSYTEWLHNDCGSLSSANLSTAPSGGIFAGADAHSFCSWKSNHIVQLKPHSKAIMYGIILSLNWKAHNW